MLTHLFRSQIRQKLLISLFLSPDAEADYPRALAARLGCSYMPVQKELQSLKEGGLLQVRHRGNRHCYVANRTHPLYRSLRRLLQEATSLDAVSAKIPTSVQGAIVELKRRLPTGSRVFLFGSHATGKASARSDWDIGFTAASPVPLTEHLQLKAAVREMAWPHRVDLVDFDRVTVQFRQLAMRQTIQL